MVEMKTIVKIALSLIIAAVIIIVVTAAVILQANQAPQDMPDETFFMVENGENASEIGFRLEEYGLIKSKLLFISYVKIKNTASLLKTGSYKITSGMTTFDIHNLLLYGAEELFNVTIPPGMTSKGISKILEDNDITSADAFIREVKKQNAEGFLFPETYSFPKNYPAERVVEFMLENFEDALESVYPEYEDLDKEDFIKKIIVASIVEREYRVADEAPIMASVFYNRIEKNMYLGSCATVVYVITEIMGKEHPEKLLYRDLDIESPYNTYRNKGLPPGPICNPGIIALNAAFNPEKTDYLYFLLEDPQKGVHTFSKSLAEHNRSYEFYIKGK